MATELEDRAESSSTIDTIARIGLVAYGVMHLLVGWLALQLALGSGNGSPSNTGAMRELAQQPFGRGLIWAFAVGMVLLTLWQLLEAALGHGDEEGPALLGRGANLARAVLYGFFAGSAIRIALGSGSGGSSDEITARLMKLPAGVWLVGLIGLVVIGVGVGLAVIGLSEKFLEDLESTGQSGTSGTTYRLLGKIGHVSKGLAIGIIGGLFCYAALTHDPNKTGGLDTALRQVLQQPLGVPLLVLVALGLACFGLFCLAQARHLSR